MAPCADVLSKAAGVGDAVLSLLAGLPINPVFAVGIVLSAVCVAGIALSPTQDSHGPREQEDVARTAVPPPSPAPEEP